jgi:hypothetical protein
MLLSEVPPSCHPDAVVVELEDHVEESMTPRLGGRERGGIGGATAIAAPTTLDLPRPLSLPSNLDCSSSEATGGHIFGEQSSLDQSDGRRPSASEAAIAALNLLDRLTRDCGEEDSCSSIHKLELESLRETIVRLQHMAAPLGSPRDLDCRFSGIDERTKEYLVENYMTVEERGFGPRLSLNLGTSSSRMRRRRSSPSFAGIIPHGGQTGDGADGHAQIWNLVQKWFRPGSSPFRHLDANNELLRVLLRMGYWDFDIFRLAELSVSPLQCLAAAAFFQLSVCEALHIDARKLENFVAQVDGTYCKNPYHNSSHAADVMQTMFYLLYGEGGLARSVGLRLDWGLAALIAAIVHDVGHMGLTNKFLVHTHHEIALLYNDISPLENMHAATAFKLMRKRGSDFLSNSLVANDQFELDQFRSIIINMVLRTDNDQHGVVVSSLVRLVEEGGICDPVVDMPTCSGQQIERIHTALVVLLHASDVSNPAKPWHLYQAWLGLLMEEFYLQGDNEKKIGLPVTYAMDRNAPVQMPKFQTGFIMAIVKPLYVELDKLEELDVSKCLSQIDENLCQYTLASTMS